MECDERPVDGGSFLKRFEVLACYGPDRSDHWIEGSLAVGRHLLRLTTAADREGAVKPLGDLVVVADAVLDNRVELGRSLGIPSVECNALADTELIARSYMKWRENCVEHLVGDFAFAVIDKRSQDVFLACDHIGSRPLYWAMRDQSVLFSTGIEALVSFPDWRWPIDERVVAEHLAAAIAPLSRPFFADIGAVPPGGRVIVRGGRATVDRWWRPSTHVSGRCDEYEAVLACRERLERAVADRIDVVAPIGAHISGGLDSTLVTVMAARQLAMKGSSLRCAYSWSPPISENYPVNGKRDERLRLEALAAAEQFSLSFGAANGAVLHSFFNRPLEFEGQADLADEVPVLSAACDNGLRVMLSGWGGDEAYSAHGRGHFAGLLLAGKFGKAKHFARNSYGSLRRTDVLGSLLWREIVFLLLPNFMVERLNPYRNYYPHASYTSATLIRQFGDLRRTRGNWVRFGIDANANLAAHITAGHISMRMRSWAAWSAPFAFQYRYPLTDRRLLEFLFTLAPERLFLDEQRRGLAQRVFGHYLSYSPSKRDYANECLRHDARAEAWRTLAADVAARRFEDDCPWLDVAAFRALALRPETLGEPQGILAYEELQTAVRVWMMYRRAVLNNWV